MADFCKQCSKELFGYDSGDLRNITSIEGWEEGMSCVVICEGCGFIQVDPDGNCISKDCLRKHDKSNF